jgi:uncharacterized membrane protein
MSNNGINDYLRELRQYLAGDDAATIQDALSDAEEYLRNGVAQRLKENPRLSEKEAFEGVIGEYGSPAEVAVAYREIERRVPPPLAASGRPNGRSPAARFFGVFTDPRAYGALFYMFFALVTGIFYFTWVTTGLSLAAGLILLIIGLPFLALFLLSVRGLALVEGRIVEALLGVRMPRRPMFSSAHLGLWARFKALFADRRSWLPMIYMVLQLPLGILYFTLFVTMIAFGLAGIATPVLQYGFDLPIGQFGEVRYYAPFWLMPFIVIVGVIWLLATMHLARGLGRLHGKFAKAMLVSE